MHQTLPAEEGAEGLVSFQDILRLGVHQERRDRQIRDGIRQALGLHAVLWTDHGHETEHKASIQRPNQIAPKG
ncbi:hypothetical protein G6F36_016173 [Rhizopus arrhizus]|nr:hypothetical protein G6F36_016173 [Rhizopus arrhizus]